MNQTFVQLAYLLAAVLFIVGLKRLQRPDLARSGNLLGATGMLIAVLVTLLGRDFSWLLLLGSLAVGAAIGAVLALRVQMTAMPQMVALLNGFGGGASVLVAGAFLASVPESDTVAMLRVGDAQATIAVAPPVPSTDILIATVASGLIGAVTFSGSLVAFGKLQELKFVRDVRFSGQQLANAGLAALCLLLGLLLVLNPGHASVFYWLMCFVALGLGVLLVVSIGGADMPVVIALLNSYSGLAAAATGFVLNNTGLIVAGSLVGSSGLVLTQVI